MEKIFIENKTDIFYNTFELLKEIITNYKNGRLDQTNIDNVFDIQKDIIKKIEIIYEELYYLIHGNNIEKSYKINNDIIDVVLSTDASIIKKFFNKNKLYNYQLFDLLKSNKYYSCMNNDQKIYLQLFNLTIIILKEICQIISLELNEMDKKYDEEIINKKNDILNKYSICFTKIFHYFTLIYNKKAEDNDYDNNTNIFLNFLNVYIDDMPYDLFAVIFNKLT